MNNLYFLAQSFNIIFNCSSACVSAGSRGLFSLLGSRALISLLGNRGLFYSLASRGLISSQRADLTLLSLLTTW